MDRADLELVVAVADTGTLTAAAQELLTAQPALSRRLARIEHQTGTILFERGRMGAQPTPGGRAVVAAARRALQAINEVEGVAARAAAGQVAIVRVGTTPTLGADLLPPALAAARAAQPDVRLELTASGDSASLRQAVRTGALDLALAVLPDHLEPGLTAAWRARQSFSLVMPADDPDATADAIDRRDLIGRPFVALAQGEGLRLLLDTVLDELGAEPRIAIETSEREMLIPFVTAGLGSTLVPTTFARQRAGTGTVVVPLRPPIERAVGAVHRAGPPSAAISTFIDALDASTSPS